MSKVLASRFYTKYFNYLNAIYQVQITSPIHTVRIRQMLTLDLFAIANRPIVRSSLEVKHGSLKVTGDSYRPFSSSNQQLQSSEAISYL